MANGAWVDRAKFDEIVDWMRERNVTHFAEYGLTLGPDPRAPQSQPQDRSQRSAEQRPTRLAAHGGIRAPRLPDED